MKAVFQFFGLLMLVMDTSAIAQGSRENIPSVVTQNLQISYAKTTSILFPYAIHSVDKGSQDILVQKAKGLENILQVKAARKDFTETNLTVVTSDGKLYAFTICYDESPETLTYTFPGAKVDYSFAPADEQQLLYGAELALYERKKVAYTAKDYGITLTVTGIFIHNDLLHYRISIANDTHISYDIDQLRFFVRDKKKAKRTASQEVEIVPLQVYKETRKVPAQSLSQFVCVLPKFTIPDDKNLIIELIEHSGGRHLQLVLKNRRTGKVFPIPAFSN